MRIYSVIFLFLLSAPVFAAAGLNEWTYEKNIDGFTDKTTHSAYVGVKEGLGFAVITVRCMNKKLEVFATVNAFLNSGDPVKVKYRFDEGEVIDEIWSISTDGAGVFSPNPLDFSEKLMAANTLLFRAYDYEGTPHDVRFPMKGSADSIAKVLNGCR